MNQAEDMDAVFRALAHADRRRVLDILKAAPGATVGEVAAHFAVSRIQVMKHLAILEEANLVISRREGRTRRLFLNAAPIQMIQDRWMSDFSALWAASITSLKHRLEHPQE